MAAARGASLFGEVATDPKPVLESLNIPDLRETGLMWANMLRAFHVGKALTSDGEPSIWMRPSRVACIHVS